MKWFAILLLSFVSMNVFASPNGQFGGIGSWKTEWTEDFKECFKKDGKNLEAKQKSASDASKYCKASSSVQPVDYWLSIFVGLADRESGFNEKAKGKNGAQIPQGLYQMDQNDMKKNECDGKDPLKAKDNICCAIKIANKQAEKNSVISTTPPQKGIMSAFWQPMRDGMGGDGRGNNNVNNSANHKKIQELAQKECEGSPSTSGVKNGNTNMFDR